MELMVNVARMDWEIVKKRKMALTQMRILARTENEMVKMVAQH